MLSYIPGERVLEWILGRCAPPGTELEQFQSFHGLQTNAVVQGALARFRESLDAEIVTLKMAIQASYDRLHLLGWIHGSADPRNLIYDGTNVFIIDFDHARPCFNARKKEQQSLQHWFGISVANPVEGETLASGTT
jgi:tRNA A-37 threonylcarbamoyl transferase component Bud32